MTGENTIRPGVGVLVFKDNQVLLGQRQNSHGHNEFGGPGGHVEYGETLEQAVHREIAEECGITIKNLGFLCVSDLLKYMPRHYLDFGFKADWDHGEPKVLEPNKLISWDWYPLDALPSPLFACTAEYVEAYKTGKTHFVVR